MTRHIPRKRFGQHFLRDNVILDNMIRAIAPQPDDLVVEIGPGLGVMTRPLLQALKHLHVVELDRDLVARLQTGFSPKHLTIHQGDVLNFDFKHIIGEAGQPLRIVGNLPYNISTPILFHLMQFLENVKDQHFMLQKEVVERMTAQAGHKAYGRLSVMLQWRYHMDMLMEIPPEAFSPPPKVDSAVVRMIPKKNPLACDPETLEQVVTAAFSQRRKMLRNTLSSLFSEQTLQAHEIDPQKRAEDLPVEDYVRLANVLTMRDA